MKKVEHLMGDITLLEVDAKALVDQLDMRTEDAGEEDVADAVVDAVIPVDPALLDEAAFHAELCRDGGDLAGVVRLVATDGDEGVGAAGEHVRDDVLELADLVAAEREATVDVLTLGPDPGAAEVSAQPGQVLQRAGAERELVSRDLVETHGAGLPPRTRVRSWACVRQSWVVSTDLPPGLAARPFTPADLDAAVQGAIASKYRNTASLPASRPNSHSISACSLPCTA
jgi:hypothetical protein